MVADGDLVSLDSTAVNIAGQPDVYFAHGNSVYLTVEVKRPTIVNKSDLVEAYLQFNANNSLVKAVCQEFGYMVVRSLFFPIALIESLIVY